MAYLEHMRIAELAELASVVSLRAAPAGRSELVAGAGVPAGHREEPLKPHVGFERLAVGTREVEVTEALGALLRGAAERASMRGRGSPPGKVVLMHPARWDERQLRQLRAAAALARLPSSALMPEPVAAASYFASSQVGVGGRLAVLEMGAAGFEAAVLEREEAGFALAGRPVRAPVAGAGAFEDRVFELLCEQLSERERRALGESSEPEWRELDRLLHRRAAWALQVLCWRSAEGAHDVRLPAPVARTVTITGEQLMTLVADDLAAAVEALAQAITAADTPPGALVAVCLAGGSSRWGPVRDGVRARLGRAPLESPTPTHVVVLGAARAALGPGQLATGEHPDAGRDRRRLYSPDETLPLVGVDASTDAVIILDHGRWASRRHGVWEPGCAWRTIDDFIGLDDHMEIFRLLDEAGVALRER